MKPLEALVWNSDPAASGMRFRAFVKKGSESEPPAPGEPEEFTLVAYEDGHWFVDHRGYTFAEGSVLKPPYGLMSHVLLDRTKMMAWTVFLILKASYEDKGE